MSEKIGHRDVLYLFTCHLSGATNASLDLTTNLRRSTITSTTSWALQKRSCTEARQDLLGVDGSECW
jgi:hypothetical protein